jgi:hypothetical protein
LTFLNQDMLDLDLLRKQMGVINGQEGVQLKWLHLNLPIFFQHITKDQKSKENDYSQIFAHKCAGFLDVFIIF